jgi:hypothetical protein
MVDTSQLFHPRSTHRWISSSSTNYAPNPYRPVLAPRGQARAVGRERQRLHDPRMPGQGRHLAAGLGIPDLQRFLGWPGRIWYFSICGYCFQSHGESNTGITVISRRFSRAWMRGNSVSRMKSEARKLQLTNSSAICERSIPVVISRRYWSPAFSPLRCLPG